MKISKKLTTYATLLVTTLMLTGVASAGDYDNVNLPSVIPTAYQDAQISVNKEKKQASDAAESAAQGNSNANASQASKDATQSENNLATNVKTLMQAGNFGTTGLFFGPTSGNSKVDAYGSLTSSVGLDKAGIEQFGSSAGDPNKVQAYHAFGLALTHLKNTASQEAPESIGFENTVGAFEKMATSVAKLGIKLVKQFNPMPVIGAFYDSTLLNNSAYSGHANVSDDNKLIKMINANQTLSDIVRFFGDPITVGGATMSFAYFATATIVFISLGYAAFLKLWNGQQAGIIFRKVIVKIVLAAVALPLVFDQGSKLLGTVSQLMDSQNYSQEQQVMRNNLNIYAWYKNSSFGLPPGTTLTVKNGYFQFTPDLVMKINQHSSTNKTSAPIVEVGPKDTGFLSGTTGIISKFLTGEDSTPKVSNKPSTENLDDKTISHGLLTSALTNNNESKVTFSPSYGASDASASTSTGNPWETSAILAYAESLGGNKKYEPKEKNITDNLYVKTAGMTASGSGINFAYSQNDTGYGISPIAAFNLMATDFNNDGFVVKTNTGEIKTPTVAVNIGTVGVSSGTVPGIVKLFMMFTILMAGIKAIMNILTSGFGGIFKGATGSAFGSAAGVGTLVGSVIALTAGIIGVSIILTISIGIIDMIWGFISGLVNGNDMKTALDEFSSDILGSIKKIWIIGPMLSSVLNSLVTLVMTVTALMMMPQIVKTPIIAYGEWVGGIPSAISERFANWERVFTGDYHSRGGSMFGARGGSYGGGGSGGSGALADMKKEEKAKRGERMGALKTGGAMIAGASLAKIGSQIAYGGNKEHSEGDNSENENVSENQNSEEMNAEQTSAEEQTNAEQVNAENLTPEEQAKREAEKKEHTKEVDKGESLAEKHSSDNKETSDKRDSKDARSDREVKDDKGSDTKDPKSEDSLAMGNTATPETHPEAFNGNGSLKDHYNPDGSLKDGFKPDGSKIESRSGQGSSNSETAHGPGDNLSISDINEEIRENFGDNHEINDQNAEIDSSQINSISSEKNELGSSPNSGSPEKSGKADSLSQRTDTKPSANTKPEGKAASIVTNRPDGKNGSTSGKGEPSKGRDSKSQRTNPSEARPRGGKVTQALGKSMMAMGGADPNQKLQKGETRKMVGAGMLHALGGVAGMQRQTGKVAQSQIDARNERILRNGGEIRSNLSAIGETRQRAQERLEGRIRTQTRKVNVNTSQAESPIKAYTERPNVTQPKETVEDIRNKAEDVE